MPESEDEYLARLLRTDPLAEAEKITGKDYTQDDETMRMGFGFVAALNAVKQAAFINAADTHMNISLEDALRLFSIMGFDELLCDEFQGTSYGASEADNETYRILWHSKGVLATVESYRETKLNMAKIYYNIEFPMESFDWSVTSSGSFVSDTVWAGDHDAREGVRHKLRQLEEAGSFLPVWVKAPFLWLVDYSQSREDGYDYKAINASRISRLPIDVQLAIGSNLGDDDD